MIFRTENSAYEVDLEHKKVRRLNGINNPTPRQGEDGQWKEFLDVNHIKEGATVFFVWALEDGVAKGTLTSPVKTIDELDRIP